MTVRPIREFGDPVLREVCRPVTQFGDGLARLMTDLTDTCRRPGRAGLAAPQIGVDLRVFCYNVDGAEGHLINPVLAFSQGEQEAPEGCLSIPGLYLPVRRAAQAVATGVDLAGRCGWPAAVNWPAACSTNWITWTGTCTWTGSARPTAGRRSASSAARLARRPLRTAARCDSVASVRRHRRPEGSPPCRVITGLS